MQPFFERWAAHIVDGVPNLLTAILILVVALYLARLVAGLLRSFLQRRGVLSHVVDVLARSLYWTILMVGVVMALQRFFDVTAFLAGLGIIGFTVGFALQDVMKNFAAGVILLLQQPFRVGEAISVAGYEGTILTIDLRTTEMSTFDGRLVTIPNGTILTNPITNFTRAPRRRVDITLQVPPTADLETVRRSVLEAMRHAPGALSEPAPSLIVQQLEAESVGLAGSFWVDITKANADAARDDVLTNIRTALEPRSASGAGLIPASDPRRSDGQQSD